MKSLLLFISVLFFIQFNLYAKDSISDVVEKVEEVDQLRESLVRGVTESPNLKVFKAVCAPVGERAMSIAKEKGWHFKQVSHKNRNPNNKAQGIELKAIKKMQNDKQLMGYWSEEKGERHYFRRITIESSCLGCHGPKNKRPEFVLKKYPKDKAYGFNKGDLRGVYHVWYKK